MDQNVVELPAMEETKTELRLLEDGYIKNIQLLPLPRANARTWTIYLLESPLSSSERLLPAL